MCLWIRRIWRGGIWPKRSGEGKTWPPLLSAIFQALNSHPLFPLPFSTASGPLCARSRLVLCPFLSQSATCPGQLTHYQGPGQQPAFGPPIGRSHDVFWDAGLHAGSALRHRLDRGPLCDMPCVRHLHVIDQLLHGHVFAERAMCSSRLIRGQVCLCHVAGADADQSLVPFVHELPYNIRAQNVSVPVVLEVLVQERNVSVLQHALRERGYLRAILPENDYVLSVRPVHQVVMQQAARGLRVVDAVNAQAGGVGGQVSLPQGVSHNALDPGHLRGDLRLEEHTLPTLGQGGGHAMGFRGFKAVLQTDAVGHGGGGLLQGIASQQLPDVVRCDAGPLRVHRVGDRELQPHKRVLVRVALDGEPDVGVHRVAALEGVAEGIVEDQAEQGGVKQHRDLGHIQRHLPPGSEFGREIPQCHWVQCDLVLLGCQLQVRLTVLAGPHSSAERGAGLPKMNDVCAGLVSFQEHLDVASCIRHGVLQGVI
mmetsp:Transcript_62475/g.102978  ORF Transcript_62475/g.102978 Transcript_62475/m.102978 type:complete len:481 (-) Transcript_62475:904-2346(-)